MKDKNNFCFKVNLVCHGKLPNENFRDSYIGETDLRIEDRTTDVNKRDEISQLFRNGYETVYHHIRYEDFKIIGINFVQFYLYRNYRPYLTFFNQVFYFQSL